MEIVKNKIYFNRFSAEDLVAKFGSPLYVYEFDRIEERLNELKSAFLPAAKILYACKANSNIEILKILKRFGLGIDAVSPGEIFLALKSGFRSRDIIFTGTSLSESDITFALNKDVLVNIDNVSVLERYGELFWDKSIFIRINPDIRAGGHKYLETGHRDTKFGIFKDDVPKLLKVVSKYGIRIVGVHQHLGSEVVHIDPFLESIEVLFQVAQNFDELHFIDIGGGYKVKYFKKDKATDVQKLGKKISQRFERFCNEYGKELQLIIEPGKYLISDAGYLLTTVQSIKKGKKKTFVGTDTGINHFIRPALYGSYHEMINASNAFDRKMTVDVVGNICESADLLAESRRISRIKEGDVICIKNAGAYCYSMASVYNSRLLPAEVLVKGSKVKLIRRKQVLKDLLP